MTEQTYECRVRPLRVIDDQDDRGARARDAGEGIRDASRLHIALAVALDAPIHRSASILVPSIDDSPNDPEPARPGIDRRARIHNADKVEDPTQDFECVVAGPLRSLELRLERIEVDPELVTRVLHRAHRVSDLTELTGDAPPQPRDLGATGDHPSGRRLDLLACLQDAGTGRSRRTQGLRPIWSRALTGGRETTVELLDQTGLAESETGLDRDRPRSVAGSDRVEREHQVINEGTAVGSDEGSHVPRMLPWSLPRRWRTDRCAAHDRGSSALRSAPIDRKAESE